MKKKRGFKSYLFTIIITMIISVMGTACFFQMNFNNTSNEEKGVVITNAIVEEKIEQIDQLTTVEFTYNGTFSKTTPREILGQRVPFADNKIEVNYEGVIKVGYVTDDIKAKVDDITKTITVSLPSPKVFDNYIIFDKTQIKEENNILNPLKVSDLPTYFESIKSEELSRAEKEMNIYNEAEKNAKKVINDIFSVFSDYRVVFVDNSK